MEKIRSIFGKIGDFFRHNRRYTYDRERLVFRKERLVSPTFIVLGFLILTLCLAVAERTLKVIEHRKEVEAHLGRVKTLEAEIADKRYTEGEYGLYTEIGMAVLDRNPGPCARKEICGYIDELAEMGIVWYPEVIKSNCQVESGFGVSNVAKKYNNLFGMDHPMRRKTLSTGRSGGRFATFGNWKLSILDRVLWDYATFPDRIPTKEEYYGKMSTKYNTENPDYHNSIKGCEAEHRKK